jgi:acetyltransferase-like isoleucine patch superfamily enzyme
MIKIIKYLVITSLKALRVAKRRYKYYRKIERTLPSGCDLDNLDNMTIGVNFSMGYDCKLYAHDMGSSISIGDRVSLNDNVMINADNGGKIEIGDGTMIAPNTVLRASNHVISSKDAFFRDQGHSSGVIQIGKNVWIGSNVVILPNVSIGDNVVIGAGSVVSKDVPNNVIALGMPAKVIREI